MNKFEIVNNSGSVRYVPARECLEAKRIGAFKGKEIPQKAVDFFETFEVPQGLQIVIYNVTHEGVFWALKNPSIVCGGFAQVGRQRIFKF